jgi:hypothetical protein
MPRSFGVSSALLVYWVSLFVGGCVHPGPDFVRQSNLDPPPPDKAIFHACYQFEDPLGIFPMTDRWVVKQIDDDRWSRWMRWESDNRIPLEPGSHWILMEGDMTLGSPFWFSFEIHAQRGHQYALAVNPGCQASFNEDVLRDTYVDLYVIGPAEANDRVLIKALCTYPTGKKSPVCRSDDDCGDNLHCRLVTESGFGMCGRPPD